MYNIHCKINFDSCLLQCLILFNQTVSLIVLWFSALKYIFLDADLQLIKLHIFVFYNAIVIPFYVY